MAAATEASSSWTGSWFNSFQCECMLGPDEEGKPSEPGMFDAVLSAPGRIVNAGGGLVTAAAETITGSPKSARPKLQRRASTAHAMLHEAFALLNDGASPPRVPAGELGELLYLAARGAEALLGRFCLDGRPRGGRGLPSRRRGLSSTRAEGSRERSRRR